MFHLGWFMGEGFKVQDWGSPSAGSRYAWNKPDLYVHGTQDLERGGFDLLVIEDSEMVPNAYQGSSEIYLKHALYAPKNDPMPLVPFLTAGTEHIGIVPTACTSFYPPFLLARLMSTLDQMSDGRVGWNIVTSTSHLSAQNYGRDQHFEHDLRYDMADEYVELVKQLWYSWDADAAVMDEASGVFVDHTKVRTIDFEGTFFKSRGPLNTIRSPQGHPVLVQAGGSPRGRAFAAKNAEAVVAAVGSVADMKTYRDELHEQMLQCGRDPKSCKILFCAEPIVADTDEEAQIRHGRRKADAMKNAAINLAGLGNITGIDFSKFDLDAPLPEIGTNGSQSTLAMFQGKDGRTLREVATGARTDGGVDLVGSAETVAERMGEIMDEVGGDGFLISAPFNPRYMSEIVDMLVPALRRRGLTRDSYGHRMFRDNLLDF